MYHKKRKIINIPKRRAYDSDDSDDEEQTLSGCMVYSVENSIFFYAEVSSKTVQKLHQLILVIYKKIHTQKNAEITIHIMTEGGDVFAGFAMYDLLQNYSKKIKIITVVEGICASAGSLIFLGTEHRFVRPHGMVLLHDISSFFGGKYPEFKAEMKTLDKLTKNLIRIYSKHTSLTPDDVEFLLGKEKWLSARKCAKINLAEILSE